MNNEGSINSIIDDLIMEDYEIVEKDSNNFIYKE